MCSSAAAIGEQQREESNPLITALGVHLDAADVQGGVRVGKREPAADEVLLDLSRGGRHLQNARLQLRDGGNVTRQHAKHSIGTRNDHLDTPSLSVIVYSYPAQPWAALRTTTVSWPPRPARAVTMNIPGQPPGP